MKIKSIHIMNVRGLGDCEIELNMIPNKPSVLVAPNGSGKSSFAFAFQWLNQQRMKLDVDDAYMGNEANKPSLVIETSDPDMSLCADETRNDITKQFGIYVINSNLKATMPGRASGYSMGKPRISVPEIVLIDKIPDNIQLVDDFDNTYLSEGNLPSGYYPVVNDLLVNNDFMSSLDVKNLECTKRPMKQISDFIARSKTYNGTIDNRHSKIFTDDYNIISAIQPISYAISQIRRIKPGDSDVKLMMRAIRIVSLYNRKKDDFEARIAYALYKKQDQACRELLSALRQTWKNLAPHKEGNKLCLKIPDTQRISNGERDIIVFMANLYKAKSKFTKSNNILIIDEVFDYLDDANLMAAQFYITSLIKSMRDEGKNIFPIILSHLNPDYYSQHYSFKDMKVYYLCPLPHPHASDNMIKLLRKRKELSIAAGPGGEDDISKYMLHFYDDYTKNMSSSIDGCPTQWADINIFKQYCMNQLNNYLANMAYDSLAVCVALRELIESRIFNELQTSAQKNSFLQKHGTPSKLAYAEEQGIDVPELYYLLGNIYNDPMHVDNKNNKLITQTLFSRLENNSVRSMIKAVKDNRI